MALHKLRAWKHPCIKYGPPAIWSQCWFFIWVLPVLDTDCFGMVTTHVHLETGNNGLFFILLNKRAPHKSTYMHAGTHTHRGLSSPIPNYRCSPSLDLLSCLYSLPFHFRLPIFSWAFFNPHQSSEITLITVSNDLYFAEHNDQLSAHLSWSMSSLTMHPIFPETILICVYCVVLMIYYFHLNCPVHLSIWIINYIVTLSAVSSLWPDQSSMEHFLYLSSKSPQALFLLVSDFYLIFADCPVYIHVFKYSRIQ